MEKITNLEGGVIAIGCRLSLEGSEVEEVAQGDILVDEWPVDADTAFDNKPAIALLGGSLGQVREE